MYAVTKAGKQGTSTICHKASPFLLFYRCKIPDLENDTYEIQSAIHQLLIDQTVPLSDTDKYDSCKLYSGNDVVYDNNSRPVNATTVGCSEWVYDTTVFKNTFTKKVNYILYKGPPL